MTGLACRKPLRQDHLYLDTVGVTGSIPVSPISFSRFCDHTKAVASFRIVSGRCQVQVRRAGVKTSRTFATREEAQLWADSIEAPLRHSQKPVPGAAGAPRTFGDALHRFAVQEMPRRRHGANEAYVLAHLKGHWLLAIPCRELTTQHLAAYRDERLQVVKPGTVRRAFNLLKPLIDIARDEWGAPFNGNPARGVTVRVGDDSRQGRLHADQMDRFLALLRRGPNQEAVRVVELALETAMRRSELLKLTWDDIDLDAGTAHLSTTKNGHPRTVALTPKAIQLLQELPHRRGPVLRCSASSIRRAFARARQQLGVEDFCFHQTRHEAISRMWELGLSEIEIANQSGHKDWKMLRRYSHVQAETLAEKLKGITAANVRHGRQRQQAPEAALATSESDPSHGLAPASGPLRQRWEHLERDGETEPGLDCEERH